MPVFAGLILLLLYSCNPTKYVAEDEYLLDRYRLRIDNGNLDHRELDSYVKPKPNKKILGVRFYLALYNLSGKKDNGFNHWLRKIGEAPVEYNVYETERNTKQLSLYMHNKGYYDAVISDTVNFRKQHAYVRYDIRPGEPYTIRSIRYYLEDTSLQSEFYPDTVNTLIKKGQKFEVDRLESERMRIENLLRNKGYFNFNHDYVYFNVDSSIGSHKVDLTLGIKKYIISSADGYFLVVPHRKYVVEEVYIYPSFDPNRALKDYQGYMEGLNREEYNDFIFLHEGKLRANPNVISQSVFIFPGEYYNQENVRQTHKHLSSLRIYKLVNIVFEEKNPYDEVRRDYYPLVCHIQLSPTTSQSYAIELEGTNSNGNLVGGAESFSARVSGAIESITKSHSRGFIIELGSEARLSLPQFLLPFKTEDFIRKYDPKTNISVAYNYQRRPEYTRSLVQTTFGYNWSGNELFTHIVNPVQLNFVNMINVTDTFRSEIEGTYLQHSYEDQLILAANYSLIFSNQKLRRGSDFVFLRWNLESAGLLLSGVARLTRQEKDTLGRYVMFGNAFAQYLKGDVEFRWYKPFDDKTSMVYRIFAGVAYPYGNSLAIPFEKQYYSGGANGVRAWHVRDLGPGSYQGAGPSKYPNKTADIKLEANVEYRFKLFWLLEGALFVDAGNIWSMNPDSERYGADFSWNRFYKEIAVGAGMGIRMDFSYFIFRTDFGFQFRDPAAPEGKRWVILHEPIRTPVFNLAIGYPF
jgi:outer membrane protein assembly factor BamA